MTTTNGLAARGAELVASGKYKIKNTPEQMRDAIVGQINVTLSGTESEYLRGTDLTEITKATEKLVNRVKSATADQPTNLLAVVTNAADLDRMTFDPLTEHVPSLITEGLFILAGPPKVGKSWLVGNIACGCASGGRVLEAIPVDGRPVLLVSLEDSNRRLQGRLRKIMRGQPLPKRLDVITDIAPQLVLPTIIEWLEQHRDSAPMVILDTLGRARPQRRSGDDPYIADYQFGTHLKRMVDDVPGAALVAVHHTRKMAAEDFLDTLSGTQGIAGSADGIIVLSRKRKSDEGTLSVTGRDIEENEYAVKTEGGLWSLDGMDITDAAATINTRRDRAAENKLGTRSLDVVKFVGNRTETTPADLAEHLDITSKAAGDLFRDLCEAGYVRRLRRGVYGQVSPESPESRESAGQATTSPPANSGDSGDSGANVTPLFGNPAEQHHHERNQ